MAEPGLPVSTNSDFTAWDPFKYVITEIQGKRVFVTADIAVLKAKLSHWSYWFADHPYNNRFNDDFLELEVKIHELGTDYNDLLQKDKKRRRQQRVIIPILCGASFLAGMIVVRNN